MTDAGTSDLDRLLGASLEAATQLLSKDGEFYPFALGLTADGDVVTPHVDPGSDHPTAEQVETLLLKALRGKRDEMRACAVCSDVTIRSDEGQEREAIRIALESPSADPLVILVPYADRRLDPPIGAPGERRVFG